MPANKYGLGLLNLVTSDKENYLSYTRGSAELVRAVEGGGGGLSFRRNTRQKCFANHLLQYRERVSCVPGDALNKYPFWLDCTYPCSVTLLGIFPCGFADRVDILLPRQRTISQPIVFGLVVPNVTPKIMCACAHPKSVTWPKTFSCLKILRVYDQYALGRIGVIPPSRALVCQWIIIGLKSCERTQCSSMVGIPGLCEVRYRLNIILLMTI